jgi:hypothetical protein
MMGFSSAVSFGSSDILLRVTHHQTRLIHSKLLFCTTQHKNNVGFNLSNHKHILHRPNFVSKQESVELDERKSPNQVTNTPHLPFTSFL